MRIFVTKRSGVPVVDQIATQIMLAIISGELRSGQRLPSIRALSTRLRVHVNSVRSAYLSLEGRNWIQLRQGSGAYVQDTQSESGTAVLTRAYVDAARGLGIGDSEIRSAVDQALSARRCDRVLVVEPEPELRKVLVAEIAEAVRSRVDGTGGQGECAPGPGALVVALAGRAAGIETVPPLFAPALWLNVNSPADLLDNQPRPPVNFLITFVSRSPDLLRIARAVLVASGWSGEGLVMKDARQLGWKRGLRSSTFVIADSIVMREIPPGVAVRQLRLISPASLAEILVRCDSSESVP